MHANIFYPAKATCNSEIHIYFKKMIWNELYESFQFTNFVNSIHMDLSMLAIQFS